MIVQNIQVQYPLVMKNMKRNLEIYFQKEVANRLFFMEVEMPEQEGLDLGDETAKSALEL